MKVIKENWPLFVISGLLLLSTGFLGAMGTSTIQIRDMKNEIVELKKQIEKGNTERAELISELRRLRNGNKTKNDSDSGKMEPPQKFQEMP